MKDADKSLVRNQDSYSTFRGRLDKLPDNVVVICSPTHTDNRKEEVIFLLVSAFGDFLMKPFFASVSYIDNMGGCGLAVSSFEM